MAIVVKLQKYTNRPHRHDGTTQSTVNTGTLHHNSNESHAVVPPPVHLYISSVPYFSPLAQLDSEQFLHNMYKHTAMPTLLDI